MVAQGLPRRVVCFAALAAVLFPLIVGCQPATLPAHTQPQDTPSGAAATSSPSLGDVPNIDAVDAQHGADDRGSLGLTNHGLDGNRIVNGRADLSRIKPIDVGLDGVPAWIVAVPVADGVVWAVALVDGGTQAFYVQEGAAMPVQTEPDSLPAGMPPLVRWAEGVGRFVLPAGAPSPASHAVPLGESLAYIDIEGNLVIEGTVTSSVLAVNALPDARILVDERQRLLMLTDPTSRYAHGVLGDDVEAGSITLVETRPEPRIVKVIQAPEPQVVEGIAPIWADLDGDGEREIIVTLSDSAGGAQVAAFAEDGTLVAQGPVVGRGNRWRHQIAVAPFGPQGQLELADVLTPHIGGVVEFYRLQDGRLEIVAQQSGHTSHVIGTRNLDMAVAAAPGRDEQADLLLPSQDRTQLSAVRHGDSGAAVRWTVEAGGTIVTNVSAARLGNGQVGVAVGRADGALRIWQPD